MDQASGQIPTSLASKRLVHEQGQFIHLQQETELPRDRNAGVSTWSPCRKSAWKVYGIFGEEQI